MFDDFPTAISNPKSIPQYPLHVICSTSASTTTYTTDTVLQTVLYSAGDVTDNTDKSPFVFSLTDPQNTDAAWADPAFGPPTFALGCDPSKGLYWSPMLYLGNKRRPFPVDIGVFTVDGPEDEETATFCGVMTNSAKGSEGKNMYQICNAA